MPHDRTFPPRKSGLIRVAACLLTILPIAAAAWGADTPRKPTRMSRLVPVHTAAADKAMLVRPTEFLPEQQGLLGRYRMALEKESRRRIDRNPELFLVQADDEDGNPVKRARTEAKRIFGGATGRLLSEFAEILVEDAVALQTAKNYVQGIRVDVMSGGSLRFQAGRDESSSRIQDEPSRGARGDAVAASFGLIAIGSPRLEMRATLPGSVRTQLEVPLTEAGFRATFSKRLTYHLRGTLSAGIEDSGADKWATVGLGVKF